MINHRLLITASRSRPANQTQRRATAPSVCADAPQPPGYNFTRDWRYYHGGVANAPAYQVAIYGFGYFPGDAQITRIYPWMGFRIGVIGDLK